MLKNKCSFFKPHRVFSPAPNRTPGAPGPLVVWTLVREKTVMPVFLKRKPAIFWGFGGKAPNGVFASFCRRGQKDVAAHLISFFIASRSFCADIPKSRFFKSGLRATFFLHTKKEGKDVPRGSPLGAPGDQPVFFLGKPAIALPPESAYIQKGPAAPGGSGGTLGSPFAFFWGSGQKKAAAHSISLL